MRRLTFLTYGADGASAGDSTRHDTPDYAVLALDDQIVRLVADELKRAAPGGQWARRRSQPTPGPSSGPHLVRRVGRCRWAAGGGGVGAVANAPRRL